MWYLTNVVAFGGILCELMLAGTLMAKLPTVHLRAPVERGSGPVYVVKLPVTTVR